jgi:two-component system, OmpR family, sensor histidine kinase KdpD
VSAARVRRALLPAAILIGVTAALAAADVAPATPWRHLYLVPVVLAGLRFGVAGGLVAALAAVLAFGPFVLREIEGHGPTRAAAEGIVTLMVLAVSGAAVGSLAARAQRQRERYDTLRAVQRTLADPAPLDSTVRRLAAVLTQRLRVDAVGLVLDDGRVMAGAGRVDPRSVAAYVLANREPVFVVDAGTDSRARRVVAVPLTSADESVGVLALERLGDFSREERDALVGFGAALGLALDNARLAARQRRFAEELEQKVGEATARLAEMDRLKSSFVALASHELRTPLTALQGFSELLAMRPFAPAEVRRLAEIMRGEIERLGRIVSDFLDLARLERGLAPSIRRTVVDPAPLITAAVELFRRTRTTHRLELHVDGALPHVDADADALDRVLKNLIGNALKYSPPGSCVRVRARSVDGVVAVDVEDEGPGIPPEERARIFEPYYRMRDTAAMGPGTGLGLSVVKSLIEAHGGTVHADAAPGTGTRMTVILPALP